MLKVNKQQEPDFLLEYKKKYIPKSWIDYNKDDIRNKIKENILVIEQEEYCPYCEKRIYTNDNGHIEHIKPRDLFPKEFQSYNNILVSCNEYLRANYTIGTLNLNSYELKEARKALIDILEVYRENYEEYNEYLQFFLNDSHNFPSLIKLYMEL